MHDPIYAIGDIHGQREMLDGVLDLIERDGGPRAQVVFLGDYTDRGPDSRAVVDLLLSGLNKGENWIAIKGNHDRLFTRFMNDGSVHDPIIKSGIDWLNPRLGGDKTLASYGVPDGETRSALDLLGEAREKVPQTHIEFLENLPLWHTTDALLFVHAGLRPGIPLDAQSEEDLIWIREGFLDDDSDHGRLVVHGHTALDAPQHFGNRVDLDSGAGYGRPLTAAVFEGHDVWVLTPNGRVPLTP